MRKHLLSVGVRPSVRPSHSRTVSKRLKISSNFSVGLVAPSLLFLETIRGVTQFSEELTQQLGKNGVEKIAVFD